MKLGDIKAQALMLMGVGGGTEITWADLKTYKQDPAYAPYIHAMNASINRCFSRMSTAGAFSGKMFLTDDFTDETDVGVHDYLAVLIPLYIVGDVFAMEEPSVAQNKRNEFEEALQAYMDNEFAKSGSGAVEIAYEVDI